jgi:hypothetical protein
MTFEDSKLAIERACSRANLHSHGDKGTWVKFVKRPGMADMDSRDLQKLPPGSCWQ